MPSELDNDPLDATISAASLAERLGRLLAAFNAGYNKKSPDSMSLEQKRALSAICVSLSLTSVYLVARTSELAGNA
jgi:hypothetical protein